MGAGALHLMVMVASSLDPMDGGSLIELSVVLVADGNNPSLLNPDFLIRHGIVEDGSRPTSPQVSTPVFSQVTFEDGVTVTADPQRIVFTSDSAERIDSIPRIAMRYLQHVPHPPCRALGINPRFRQSLPAPAPLLETALRDRGRWMSFRGIGPNVQLKFVYPCGDRTITLDIAEKSGARVFLANVHRDLSGENTITNERQVESVLNGWHSDLADVRGLMQQFRGATATA